MAEPSSSIFTGKASEKLRSPDDLEKYVRVTNPSVWVVLIACIALVAGFLAWGVFGTVTTNVQATAAVVEVEDDKPQALCFLSSDEMTKVKVGDAANVGGQGLTVSSVNGVPLSGEEARELLQSDYLVSALMKGDWAYVVFFEGDISDLSQDVPLSANISVESMAPIKLILKNWG